MPVSVSIDIPRLEASRKAAEKVLGRLSTPEARKAVIDKGNAALVEALRLHFAEREREPQRTAGFPWFGQPHPKRYFWRGTRGDSVHERISYQSSPDRLEGLVSIQSPALAHKLDHDPPPMPPHHPPAGPHGRRRAAARVVLEGTAFPSRRNGR